VYGFSHFWQFMWGIMWKRTKTHQKVCWIFFVAYLVLLIYFMFFSDGFGRAPHVEYAYNLVLFKEIKRFYIYRDIVGTEAFLLNTAGNVVCFMPFGFPCRSSVRDLENGT
jgi:glycopeptide antibiotics resistance protein